MSDAPWTIERIRDTLGSPALVSRFLGELNRATVDQLVDIFAKWQRIAENTEAAFDPEDPVVAAVLRGEEPPGEWHDRTDKILAEADRIRSRGAA